MWCCWGPRRLIGWPRWVVHTTKGTSARWSSEGAHVKGGKQAWGSDAGKVRGPIWLQGRVRLVHGVVVK